MRSTEVKAIARHLAGVDADGDDPATLVVPWGQVKVTKVVSGDLVRLVGVPRVRMPWITRHQNVPVVVTLELEGLRARKRVHADEPGEPIDVSHYAAAVIGVLADITEDLRLLRDGLSTLGEKI